MSGGDADAVAGSTGNDSPSPAVRGRTPDTRASSRAIDGTGSDERVEPCLRCGVPLPLRQRGCKGGHCPNCAHPYPHGDCSD